MLGLSLTDFKNVPKYEKIKHLVEVDDDILAVLIVTPSQGKDLSIANNLKLDPSEVVLIYDRIVVGAYPVKIITEMDHNSTGVLSLTGNLKWIVIECQLMQIFVINEQNFRIMD